MLLMGGGSSWIVEARQEEMKNLHQRVGITAELWKCAKIFHIIIRRMCSGVPVATSAYPRGVNPA